MTQAGSVDKAECRDSSSRAASIHLWCPSVCDAVCCAPYAACFSTSEPPAWWLTLLTFLLLIHNKRLLVITLRLDPPYLFITLSIDNDWIQISIVSTIISFFLRILSQFIMFRAWDPNHTRRFNPLIFFYQFSLHRLGFEGLVERDFVQSKRDAA